MRGADCKLTQWTSNTAIACTTAPCTTFLAGLNVDLPIQVEVGLGHRLDSDQVGLLDRYYTYDRPIEIFFNLNNIEINFLLFSGAVLIAAAIVCCLHVQYRKHWRPPMPDLPTRYARTPLDDQAKIRPHKIMPIDQKRFEDENKDSSSSDSGFYDFEDGEEGEFNPEEADRLDSAFRLGRDATMAVQTKKAINSSTPLLGKDVVTGQTVVYEEVRCLYVLPWAFGGGGAFDCVFEVFGSYVGSDAGVWSRMRTNEITRRAWVSSKRLSCRSGRRCRDSI